ncbi:MAG TPA: hypothetical protein VK196_22355 [Magnetospirillum sp.]|nr:hypothetical protein [Magnetospirillum sp.]
MDIDTDDSLDTERDDTSLRDALESAFDETPAEGETPPEEPADTEDDGQPRDEQGRWTKAQQEHFEEQERQRAEAQQPQEGQQPEGLTLAPPIGWSPTAKAAFAELPPAVQEAVARREQEINQGFAKLRDFKGLEEYSEMARQSGTTLKEAFDRYRAAEQALDQNFHAGVAQLCEMYDIHPVQLAQDFLRAFGQGGQMPQGMDPQSQLLARRLHGMEETVRTLISERERQEQEGINAYISDFSQNAVYFENVRRDMADLIRAGKAADLQDAYDKACWMNPEIRDLLIKQQAAPQTAQARVDQARRASGSLRTGAPAGNASGSTPGNLRSALEQAWGEAAI